MKRFVKLIVAVLVGSAVIVSAQLGHTEPQCGKVWGSPIGGKLDESGVGVLRYSSKEVSIELEFFGGMVFRSRYHKSDMGEKDVDSLLRLNNNNVEWDVWTAPGIPVSEQKSTRWMRSDEGAMAELKDGTLRVSGPPPVEQSRIRNVAVVQSNSTKSSSKTPSPSKNKSVEKTEVQRPDTLPSLGDSKTDVLHLLGEPTGTMMTGGKEILIYEWGNIWVAQGKVLSVN